MSKPALSQLAAAWPNLEIIVVGGSGRKTGPDGQSDKTMLYRVVAVSQDSGRRLLLSKPTDKEHAEILRSQQTEHPGYIYIVEPV